MNPCDLNLHDQLWLLGGAIYTLLVFILTRKKIERL